MAKIRPLDEHLQKVAIEQLNEVPERVSADLEALKTWIEQQPHLRARTDDQFLLAFLRGCKYSLEKTKSKLDTFYTLRSKYPHLFNCTDVKSPRVLELLRKGVILYMPTPLHDNGPRLGIMRMGKYDPSEYRVEEICALSMLLQEYIMMEDDYAVVNGVVFIMDLENATAAHMMQMTPSLMKITTTHSEKAIPLRPKASHFLNTSSIFEPIFNLFKPMLSKKLQSRLFVHGKKFDLLHKEIPKKYLPKEYGGENGTTSEIIAEWEKKLTDYADFFEENANYGTDELLRPGKPFDFEGQFGLEGSFRKLNVD